MSGPTTHSSLLSINHPKIFSYDPFFPLPLFTWSLIAEYPIPKRNKKSEKTPAVLHIINLGITRKVTICHDSRSFVYFLPQKFLDVEDINPDPGLSEPCYNLTPGICRFETMIGNFKSGCMSEGGGAGGRKKDGRVKGNVYRRS